MVLWRGVLGVWARGVVLEHWGLSLGFGRVFGAWDSLSGPFLGLGGKGFGLRSGGLRVGVWGLG